MEIYNTYTLNNKILIMFDPTIKYNTYAFDHYHGIIFYIPGDGNQLTGEYGTYDILDNEIMGSRILISNTKGWQDFPFKKETFKFLPPGIKAVEI